MNILFIEDEKELALTGVAQLELKGYTVFPAYDIAEAKAVLEDPERPVHFIITDHRLPDGAGIEFVIEVKDTMPCCKCAVVSGCLTNRDIEKLVEHKIPYYHKPLLYAKVIEELRRMHAAKATDYVKPESEPEPPAEPEGEVAEPPAEGKKSGFRKFWPFK